MDSFIVKMRASANGKHISGAERIVDSKDVERTLVALSRRAFSHERGKVDFVNLKVTRPAEPVKHLVSLKTSMAEVSSPEEGWDEVERVLSGAGVKRVKEIRELFKYTYPMRGAMVLDAATLERLEPDRERGVRVSNIDSFPSPSPAAKCHYAEALALATKVLAAPGIIAEICVSDDPEYVTGYVSTQSGGYRRISCLKTKGAPEGGRIFLFSGDRSRLGEIFDFLQNAPVIVTDIPEAARKTPLHGAPPLESQLSDELAKRRDAGLERVISIRDDTLASFASNDYLGLADDPRVKQAAADAALAYGAGAGASRLVTGTLEPHIELERHIASFKHSEDAIAFSTGYMANLGAITAIAKKGDIVFSDELNHASIIDACKLSGAEIAIYKHLDMDDLARRLSTCAGFRRRLAVSDGVFSMDGDLLDLERFTSICRRYNAFSMVDEAHSTGVIGETGHGLEELYPGYAPDIMMGTLSKALGSQGGYVAASHTIVEYLRQTSRAFIFNTAPNPAAMAAASKALEIIETEPERVNRLHRNIALLNESLGTANISAIFPILIGDEKEAVRLSNELKTHGYLVPAIRYPTVKRGAARLRIAVSAVHSPDDISGLANILGQLKG